MASVSMMHRPVCTLDDYALPTCTGLCRRSRGRRISGMPVFAFQWRRDWGLWADLSCFSVQLPLPSSKSLGVVLLPQASSTKQENKTADKTADKGLGSLASKFPFFKEETWGDRNGGVFMDPYADPGPEFDYRVYAANSMEGFEPPPEPRIPFGGPFEDYYDKYVGVDYVPKQEKPTSSFLMFLEELNKKRAEEEAKLREKDPSRPPFDPKPNKHLFEGKKPLFTLSRPIEPASPPRPYTPPVPGEEIQRLPLAWPDDEPEFVPRKKVVKVTESLSEPLIPQGKPVDVPPSGPPSEPAEVVAEKRPQNAIVEEFSPTSTEMQTVSTLSSQNEVSPDNLTSVPVSLDEIKPLSPQTKTFDSLASSSASPPSLQAPSTEEAKADSAPSIPQPKTTQEPDRLFSPHLRTSEESVGNKPISPPTSQVEATSGTSRPLFPQTRPVDESQQGRGEQGGNRSLTPQTRPIDVARPSGVPPYAATSMPMGDSTTSSLPQTQASREKEVVMSSISQAKGMEEFRSVVPSTRPIEIGPQPESLFQNQPLQQASAVSQVGPVEEMFDRGGQPLSQPGPVVDTQPMFVESRPVDGIVELPTYGQVADSGYGFGLELQKSQYYEPKIGDLVLATVINADNYELDLEIGADQPGLMSDRDFQPIEQIEESTFFGLPPSDGSSTGFVAPPIGRPLVVEDKAANDGVYRGQYAEVGTVVLAEVQTFLHGRAVLSCRRPARILSFYRIQQLKETGEPVQIVINNFNDGGLQGFLEGVRAFLPKSELIHRLESHGALQNYVGRTLTVSIVQVEEQTSNVIISEQKPWMSENLLLGSVHDLTISRIYPYGLQVEINNTRIRGFIHISNITRDYVPSLHSCFTEGEQIRAMLIKGRRPDQPSFSIEALEPLDARGLVLRDRQQVFLEAEEVAMTTEEYQLPMEERRIFALRSALASSVSSPTIANLPWLQLQESKRLF